MRKIFLLAAVLFCLTANARNYGVTVIYDGDRFIKWVYTDTLYSSKNTQGVLIISELHVEKKEIDKAISLIRKAK